MLSVAWSLQTEERALSMLEGGPQAEEQQTQGRLNMNRPRMFKAKQGQCGWSGGGRGRGVGVRSAR